MTRTKQTNTRRKETNDRRRDSGARTDSQMRRIIRGILGEQGKDRMYEERGAGRSKEGPAGLNGDEIKDEPEGQNVDKDGPAGRDKTKTEDKPRGREGKVTKDRPAEKGGRAPGPRYRGQQQPLLLPPSHARTGGGPQ